MGEGQQIFVAILVLLSLLASATGYCSQGSEWIEYDGNCYRWSRTGANWFKAELTCQQSGGHLVSIKSHNDNDFLLRLTQCSSDFWIGMVSTNHSLKAQVPAGYEWWDGTQHNYTRLSRSASDYRDCVYSRNSFIWYNYYCQHNFSYVCMAPAAQRQRNLPDNQQTESEQQPDNQHDANAVWWSRDYTTDGTTSPLWPTPTPSPSKCQPGWQLMDNSCYFVSANRTNYFNAQMSCQAMGASVTSIITDREQTLLTVALGCRSPKWIGLEKARPCFKQPNKDHCWVWMDRNPTAYFDWASGQTIDRRDAECVILDGQWKVVNCYAEYGYVCKMPAYGLKTSD